MVLLKSVFRIYLNDHVSVHIFKKNKRSNQNRNSYLEGKGGWHEKKGRYCLPSCLIDDTWSSTLTFIPEEKEAHRATRLKTVLEFTHSISKDREWGWNVSLSTFVVTGPFFSNSSLVIGLRFCSNMAKREGWRRGRGSIIDTSVDFDIFYIFWYTKRKK